MEKREARWRNEEQEHVLFLYHTPGIWELSGPLWTVRGGRTATKPNYRVGPKRIADYSLHYILAGSVWLEYGDQRVELGAGNLFCLYPGQVYTYGQLAADHALQMAWVVCGGPTVEQLLTYAGFSVREPYRRLRHPGRIAQALDQLLLQLQAEPMSDLAVEGVRMQSYLLRLLAELMSDRVASSLSEAYEDDQRTHPGRRMAEEIDSDGSSLTPATRYPRWFERSIRYADLHACEGMTVEELADLVGINRNYFSTAFSQLAGKSPSAYLQERVMERAVHLLLDQQATVAEIAYSLGYADPYGFTRAFKRYYGMPPTQYRKLLNTSGQLEFVKQPAMSCTSGRVLDCGN